VVDNWGRRHEDLEDTSDVVAYKLALPDYMQMHYVFHVSLLKQYRDRRVCTSLPPTVVDGKEWYMVDAILSLVTRKAFSQIE